MLHTHLRGPGSSSIKCIPSSANTQVCKTDDKSAAIDTTLRLLLLTCNIQEERTKRHIIYIRIEFFFLNYIELSSLSNRKHPTKSNIQNLWANRESWKLHYLFCFWQFTKTSSIIHEYYQTVTICWPYIAKLNHNRHFIRKQE